MPILALLAFRMSSRAKIHNLLLQLHFPRYQSFTLLLKIRLPTLHETHVPEHT
jgi:hypothetical protein